MNITINEVIQAFPCIQIAGINNQFWLGVGCGAIGLVLLIVIVKVIELTLINWTIL